MRGMEPGWRGLLHSLRLTGYLVLGASETTWGLSDAFAPAAEGSHGIFKCVRIVPKAVAAA